MPIFTIDSIDGLARAGVLHTPHGDVPTPAFLPVATQGSVKALDPSDLESMGATILLGNTYHLYLRPGVDVIEKMGGLNSFMGWDGPALTDSGGFQVFSLAHLRKITEGGVLFRSHIDGSTHEFSPEAAVRHQEGIGADIIMPLDVCVPSDADRATVEESVGRTTRWALRCREAHTKPDQALFGIVQGGLFPDLRRRSAESIVELGFQGYAVGGLSVGESKEEMHGTAALTAEMLPDRAPRHLLGVGSPEDLVEAVGCGFDMFDCALPTRIARNGSLFVREGRVNIDTAPFRGREGPIEEGCDCYTCRTFSTAYVHHLFRAKERLAYRLATVHNLRFVLRLMGELRQAVVENRYESYRTAFHERFVPPDHETRRVQKRKWLESLGRKPSAPGNSGDDA